MPRAEAQQQKGPAFAGPLNFGETYLVLLVAPLLFDIVPPWSEPGPEPPWPEASLPLDFVLAPVVCEDEVED